MKISQEELESAKVSSVKKWSDTDRKGMNTDQEESTAAFQADLFEYLNLFPEWKTASTLRKALDARLNGILAISMREADIAARGNIDLGSRTITEALLLDMGLFLTEGIVCKDSAYILRENYNRGIEWRRHKKESQPEERQAKGEEAMQKILDKLDELNLPAWDEEKENGFHSDLCKPEWMNHDYYLEIRNRTLKEVGDESHD